MRILFVLLASVSALLAQSSSTARHIGWGPNPPASCSPLSGDVFFKTTATVGMYQCTATNTWSYVGSGGGTGTVTSVGTSGPITGGPIVGSGTITCPTCTTNAAAATANRVMIGGGLQAISALGSAGTTTTVLHGNAGGAPTFGQIVNGDITNATIDLTAKVTGLLPKANGGLGLDPTSLTGVIQMTAGVPSIVSGTSSNCVLVDGTSGPCGTPGAVTFTGSQVADALVTRAGSSNVVQNPFSGATLDTSGNMNVTSLTAGAGGGLAGTLKLGQGTAPGSPAAGFMFITVPSSVTAYTITMPGAQGTGALTNDGAGNLSWSPGGGGSGDVSSNTSVSVNSELALFNGTSGKSIKRATGSGVALLVSGVLSTVATTGSGTDCFLGDGTFGACPGGGGGVSFTGTQTANAFVTNSSSNVIKTPSTSATLDTSGNASFSSVSTTGGACPGCAGFWQFGQGTTNTPDTNVILIQAPTSVPSSYTWTLPGADAAGAILSNGSGVLSMVATSGSGNLLRGTTTGSSTDCFLGNATFGACPGGSSIPNLSQDADGTVKAAKSLTWAAAYAPTYNAGGTTTCDWSQSNVCQVTMSGGNTTLAFSNTHGSGLYMIRWVQDTTPRTFTAPGGSSGLIQPDPTSGSITEQLISYAGATYYGGAASVPTSGWEGIDAKESSAATARSGYDLMWADLTAHRWKMINNGGSADTVAGLADLSGYAPLANPTFTGTPAAPTASGGTNTTQLATTAFVHGEVATLGTATKIRTCELHIWGSGTSQVLQDGDDEAASCYNDFGATETVTAVRCWANAGSPTILPAVTGGSNLLTGNLTCGTASWASGTLNGTPTLASAGTIDGNIVTAGGTATNIRIEITLTRP